MNKMSNPSSSNQNATQKSFKLGTSCDELDTKEQIKSVEKVHFVITDDQGNS